MRGLVLQSLLHEDFQAWLLADYGVRRTTAEVVMRRVRYLERRGMDWAAFLSGAEGAKMAGRRMLAGLRMAGVSNTGMRHSQSVLNLVALYAATLNPEFDGVHWDLSPPQKAAPKTLTDDQAAKLADYRHRDEITEKRRRALLWMMDATGLRRSEIALMRVSDLDESSSQLYVAFPSKEGMQRHIPLPQDAWSPKRPLQAWLKVRPVDKRNPDALWTLGAHWRQPARAITPNMMTTELDHISRDVGFRVSFVRYRRRDTMKLDEAGVHPRSIQYKRGHAKLDWTMHYMGQVTAQRVLADLIRAKAPGFKAAGRKRTAHAEVPLGGNQTAA